MKRLIVVFTFSMFVSSLIYSQQQPPRQRPEETEYYTPVPKVVTPGNAFSDAPSDAVILFDGRNMDQWINTKDSTPCKWVLDKGAMTVNKSSGDIQTRSAFNDFQLHIEYRIPENITGSGQARGNSGIFLAALPWGAGGYELQVLDNYKNTTYVNGQVGSMYKQAVPLANACKKPGEWQTYDVIWTSPKFSDEGILKSMARVTVFHNGVLVQNNVSLLGDTPYIGQPSYRKHGASPIKLQAHGDPSEPISYRNIWLRPL